MSNELYTHNEYLLRRKVLTFAGAKFHIYDPDGNLAFYSKMKAFKLKEDIRVYHDEEMQQELLLIQARSVIDFSATYDVFDQTTGEKIGAYRRKGLKSMLQDEWLVMDANDNEVGLVKEDSTLLALVRRFVANIIPQTFHATIAGQQVWSFKQNFNPFVHKIKVSFHDPNFEKRMGIAGAILLAAIEGRQK